MLNTILETVFPGIQGSDMTPYFEAAVIVVIAAAIGFVADQILYRVVASRSKAIRSIPGIELAHGLHGFPTAVGAVIGAQIALLRIDLTAEARSALSTAVTVAAIVVTTAFAARVAGRLIRAYTQREDARLPSSTIFVNLARGLVWIIGGLSLLAALGISIAPLLTALGVGGLAIGLALQSTLENVFSGIQVLLSRQIEPGDFVQLESGEQGWVEDVTWRNTTIKLFSNDLVIVPNAMIAQSRVTNFTTEDVQHVLWMDLGVAYDSDLELVERITVDTAREILQSFEGAVADYEPLFRFTEFGDSAINLTISLRATSVENRFVMRHKFVKLLKARYDAEGIGIPFPQRTIHMAQPSNGTPLTEAAD